MVNEVGRALPWLTSGGDRLEGNKREVSAVLWVLGRLPGGGGGDKKALRPEETAGGASTAAGAGHGDLGEGA